MLRSWQWLLLGLLVVDVVLSSPVRNLSGYVVKEEHAIPDGWLSTGPAPPQHTIRLQIGLKSSGFDELERHLYEGMPSIDVFCRRSL